MTSPLVSPEVVQRFWALVQRGDGCWSWTGSIIKKDGRGIFYFDRKNWVAARFLLQNILGKPLSKGQMACHHCDNPNCVRPDHLFIGDAGSNARDAAMKGRFFLQRFPKSVDTSKFRFSGLGAANPFAKLTDSAVVDIFTRYWRDNAKRRELAEEYGVSGETISRIAYRKGWRHATESLAQMIRGVRPNHAHRHSGRAS